MADFTNTANTGNNPDEWLTNYSYNPTTDVVSINFGSALGATGVTDTDLDADSGDVRSVYLALAEALFIAYDAKDDSAATTSGRLKMTKSQVVQNLAPTGSFGDGVHEDIRYTTYTIHVQEQVEQAGPYFTSAGVRAE
tara:strand:+ start:4824 stop:5237 length:414 start_codon:yes stop_codon:yes gene_type:complete